MRRTAILMAAVSGLVASSSFASFTFVVTPTVLAGPNDRLDIRAINDGTNGTGTRVSATNLTFTLSNGAKAYFRVTDTGDGTEGSDPDGVLDTVDLQNGPTDPAFGYIRVGAAATTFIASSTPGNGYQVPNPYLNGVSTFSAASTTTATQPLATGAGTIIARLVLTDGGGFTLTGDIAGDTGDSQAINVTYPVTGGTNLAPVVTPGVGAVVFGKVVSNGAPFSVFVAATDPNVGDILTLTSTPPAGVTNVTATPTTGGFTVTGTVAYSLNGTTVIIPISVSDGQLSTASIITLAVTPEPTSLLALAGAAGFGMIRRRK